MSSVSALEYTPCIFLGVEFSLTVERFVENLIQEIIAVVYRA